MLRFILRRLAASFLLLYLVLTAVFFLVHLAPGTPEAFLLNDQRLPPAQQEILKEHYGLNRPLLVQYALWMASTLRGDWGTSFSYQRPVTGVIGDVLPATCLLAAAGLLVEQALGLILGIAAARRPGSTADHLIRIVSLVLYSQPIFWFGLMAILLFSLVWPVLPPGHLRSIGAEDLGPVARVLDVLRHLILPGLVLGLSTCGEVARFVRASLLDVLGQEHIRASRAKGLTERRVVWVHALRNVLAPLLQIFAVSLSALLGGVVVVEVVFSWPGLGRLTFDAVFSRDYPLILGTTAFAAVAILAANLLADVLHAVADPRVRDE
ncbi:MAG TPA: ABC transporter permease [Thermoanaerobaculia bacterium]|jgi:peptide/nickel transport system permease protein|nr:ABC transporter permease [Thermoanaerobaculia bacterium]